MTNVEKAGRHGLDATLRPGAIEDREVKRALSKWEQGHVLTGVPVAWVGPSGEDSLTGLDSSPEDHDGSQANDPDSPRRLPVVEWDELDVAADGPSSADRAMSDAGFAIITSQTCDIQATGPGSRHTHVQVCPVVRLDGAMAPERLKDAKQGTVVELVYLPDFDQTGDWFADLRLSLPVSKTVLIQQTPTTAFADPSGAQAFSERVAVKIRRPALHDAVDSVLRPQLRKFVREQVDEGKEWPSEVEQFRVQCLDSRLEPRSVTILAICYSRMPPAGRVALTLWARQVAKQFRRQANGASVRVRCTTVDKVGVRDYRDSVFMHIPELSGHVFW